MAAFLFCGMGAVSASQNAKWIYYPGDFEIWVHKNSVLQRTERNQPYVPIWRVDSPYGTACFSKRINITEDEHASIRVNGTFFIRGLGNQLMYDFDPNDFILPAGDYVLSVWVKNYETVPSIWFKSKSYQSDESWYVRVMNADNVPASVYDSSAPDMPPSSFCLATEPQSGLLVQKTPDYLLYDFGKNTFGYPVLHGIRGKGLLHIYYGESREEAMADKLAETWDELAVEALEPYKDTLATKAFRYVKIVPQKGVLVDSLSMLYEYLPVDYRGNFTCSDSLVNKVYETSMYTLHLTTREVHLDGIKRDRWAWSGDALQSYWMNMYSFFDENVNKRTIWGLRGHSPVVRHMNTILDYSFYWLIGIETHYLYTADSVFVRQIYPRMKETIDFCISRLNAEGFAEGRPDDWVFVDWAPIDKSGELSFEQLLFMRSLLSMKCCAEIVGDHATAFRMQELFDRSQIKFEKLFWSEEKKAYLHNRKNGQISTDITRYTNMFAILFDFVDEKRKQQIKQSVILNDKILPITTPYMKFYELAALCEIGEHAKVLDFVKAYWGGMLSLGATTIWETFDPTLPADRHYAMYNRPFGKSLCHAWGANPVYLMGRYFLGIYPTSPGYESYRIEPNLGGLEWMKGSVPTPSGDIHIEMDKKRIVIKTAKSQGGVLYFSSRTQPQSTSGEIVSLGKDYYSIKLTQSFSKYIINIKQ